MAVGENLEGGAVGAFQHMALACGGDQFGFTAGNFAVQACFAAAGRIVVGKAGELLPLGLYAETAGSFVNTEGRLQSFNGAVQAPGMARPGWKILRVLGNLFNLDGFDYESAEEIRGELAEGINRVTDSHTNQAWQLPDQLPASATAQLERVTFIPTNSLDPLVRHADALQSTFDVADGSAHVHPQTAERLGLESQSRVRIRNGSGSAELPVVLDELLATDCVLIHATHPDAIELGGWFGDIELQRSGG